MDKVHLAYFSGPPFICVLEAQAALYVVLMSVIGNALILVVCNLCPHVVSRVGKA